MVDDDEYTIIYRKPKENTPDLPTEELDNSLSMGDEHLNTIPEMEKSSVENLVSIPSEVKIDFLPEEFAGELDLIDPILPGIDEDDFDKDDFDEEEGAIDIDILQIEDEILHEKLLKRPIFSLKNQRQEVDTFLVLEDSIPPGIESDFDSEGDNIFLDNLLNDDPIPEYELGGEIVFSQNVEDDDSFTFVIRTFLPFLAYPEDAPLLLSTGSEDTILTPSSLLKAGGISSGWNFHLL
ncbi:hypothetical protein Tco_0052033 [Tanacetum coccineum]